MKVILASRSPFRKKALDILGLEYEAIPSNLDEKSIRDKNPEKLAKKLAEAKARAVGDEQPDSIIIAGDLFVMFNGRIYEKPENEQEAFEMLKTFSGNEIYIVIGIAVYNSKTKKMFSSVDEHKVKFRKLLDYEIMDYISRYPVLNFAGAFDMDGLVRFAERAEGRFPFLTGFPMSELIYFLRENNPKV